MLDVGLYQLDQQVACQRYRQTIVDAKSAVASLRDRVVASLASVFQPLKLVPVLA